jgi:indole-3-glycerol phosphate synthase
VSQVLETGTVLDRIVDQTRLDLAKRMERTPRSALQDAFSAHPAPIDMAASLRADSVQVIAEIKRASPSKGAFPVAVNPPAVAADYARGGAAAISCLTDAPFFQGSLDDLAAVTSASSDLGKPIGVLRKDFMVDPYQIDEARAFGASCILLIAACLDDQLMQDLHDYAASLGLSVLVEVHDERELERALRIGPTLLGINNRDLKTLKVDLETTLQLAQFVPADVVLIGESGILTRAHVEDMASSGVDAVLVGESLIVQDDRAAAVAALLGVEKCPRG